MKNTFLRFISFAVSLIMIFCMLPANVLSLEFMTEFYENVLAEPSLNLSAGTYDALVSAINDANTAGGAVITLTSDITITADFPAITSEIVIEGTHTLLRDSEYTGKFFTVNSGATLTLDGGLTIDGGNNWQFDYETYWDDVYNYASVIPATQNTKWFELNPEEPVSTARMMINNGTLNLYDVTIQNNYSSANGVVTAGTGSITNIEGANIKHIATYSAGGTVVSANGANKTVNIKAGTVIEGNHAGFNFGMFDIENSAVLNMTDGKIINNTAWNCNGVAVGVTSGGKFNFSGGTICGNSGERGPGNNNCPAIYVHSSGVLNMSGGEVCHNVGSYSGGVFCLNNSGTMNITGGKIVNNVSTYGDCTLVYLGMTTISVDHHDICGESRSSKLSAAKRKFQGGTFSSEIAHWVSDNYGTAIEFTTDENGDELIYYTVTNELVEIKGKPEKYHSIGAAAAAAEDGDELIVLKDHRVYGTPETITKNITVNLNGHTVYGWKNAETGQSVGTMFNIMADVTFTNGIIDASQKDDATVFTVGSADGSATGNLTLINGTYRADGNIATVESGELYINDGFYDTNPIDGKYALDCNDTNYINGTANITIFGGTFTNFDPEENGAEGDGTDFCASQYLSKDNNDNSWTVIIAEPACWNMQTGKYYKTVAEGLAEAKAKETVQLLKSMQEGDLQLLPGTKLDINGFTLSADNVVGVGTTHIYDGANNSENGYRANGVLRIAGELILADDNCAIPVYSPVDGGYIFVDFLFNQGQDQFNGISRINALVTSRTTKIITLLRNGASDNDIQIGIRLTVNAEDSVTFVFTDDTIKTVMNSNGGKFNLFDRMFYANFTGVEDFTGVTAELIVIAHGNVIDSHKDVIVLK